VCRGCQAIPIVKGGSWHRDFEEAQSEGVRVVGERRGGGTGRCGGDETDDFAARGEAHRGQMAGQHDADPTLEVLLGQGGVEGTGETCPGG